MNDKEVQEEFLSIVENSFGEIVVDDDEIPQGELDLVALIKAVARMNELSTFLSRYVLSSFMLGPDQMAPLGEQIIFGINEVEQMAVVVLKDLSEYANACDCPDCMCECEELPEDLICDSCVRVEDCVCGLDGTCSACIEYELKNSD